MMLNPCTALRLFLLVVVSVHALMGAEAPHPAPVTPVPAGEKELTAKDASHLAIEDERIRTVEAIRRWGSAQAPLHAEFIIDINCAHCGDLFTPTFVALEPAITLGEIAVNVRWVLRPAEPAARDLAMHILSAHDAEQCRLLGSLLIGTPAGRNWRMMRTRLSEVIDPVVIEQRYAEMKSSIEAVLQRDSDWLRVHAAEQVPTFIVFNADGLEMKRWSGKDFNLAQLMLFVQSSTADAVKKR